MQRSPGLDAMLKPESIAVVGASRDKPGASWVDMFGQLVEFGYRGRLYPINPKADVIRGYKAYAGLPDLPEPVDLVIIGLSAPIVPWILRDCVATGNRNVHIFSAGFGETGEDQGKALQEEITKIAVEGGLRVIGPQQHGRLLAEAPAGHLGRGARDGRIGGDPHPERGLRRRHPRVRFPDRAFVQHRGQLRNGPDGRCLGSGRVPLGRPGDGHDRGVPRRSRRRPPALRCRHEDDPGQAGRHGEAGRQPGQPAARPPPTPARWQAMTASGRGSSPRPVRSGSIPSRTWLTRSTP